MSYVLSSLTSLVSRPPRLGILTLCSILASCSAFAARTLGLADPLPMDRPTGYQIVAGGHVGTNTIARAAAGTPLYEFPLANVGFTDAAAGTIAIGEPIEAPADMEIDWAKMSERFSEQSSAQEGYVFYTGSTNVNERVIVARSGTFELSWYDTDGNTREVTYTTRLPASLAKHRLFWTSSPVNGPKVGFPSNFGIRLFGDPNLFMDEANTNEYGVAIQDYGVHYSMDANSCEAYCHTDANGTLVGPCGMFVVAYYDNGDCQRYLGCTVVQVSGPDIVYLSAKVGDEVRPQFELYDPTSSNYDSQLASEDNDTDDPRAPYFYKQDPITGFAHRKENRVYAISETVPGQAGAKRAEIWWKAADDFDVYWPFEETCYSLTWPECPTVVIGSEGTDGTPGVELPSGYTPSLLDWKVPGNTATVSGDELVLLNPGHFTLKLTTDAQDDFVLVPLKVAASDDASVFPIATSRVWTVAREVTSDDYPDYPGFIYEPSSPGRNWNTNGVDKAIHLVNVTDGESHDLEVWWSRSYAPEGLDGELVFPCQSERFKAAWPIGYEAQDIVFASERGSGLGGLAADGHAVRLMEPGADGVLAGTVSGIADEAVTFAFWMNPGPHVACRDAPGVSTGCVCSIEFGTLEAKLTVEQAATENEPAHCRFSFASGAACDFTVAPDNWMLIAAVISTNGVVLYGDGKRLDEGPDGLVAGTSEQQFSFRAGCGEAAVGVSIDQIVAWNFAIGEDEMRTAVTNGITSRLSMASIAVNFEDDLEADGVLYASDNVTLRYLTGTGMKRIAPGGPMWTDGYLQATNGVVPRIYAENNSKAIGYNPNEEHALVLGEDAGYCVYALRSDMNDDANPPYAFVEYERDGRVAMNVYRVHMTNEWFAWPTIEATAGEKLVLPHPLDAMPSGVSPATTAAETDESDGATPFFRDRTGTDWVRRAGAAELTIYYRGEEGFVCTGGDNSDRSLAGMDIPLLNLANAYVWPATSALQHSTSTSFGVDRETLLKSTPTPVATACSWPSVGSVAEMSIAQALSKAENSLPDVYDMKTCAVLYPFRAENRVVKLIDPTQRREVGISVTSNFPEEYGFTLGTTGNCFLRNNYYYFANLPASVADRFYVDTTGSAAKLVLEGDYCESDAGTSYLRVNTLAATDAKTIVKVFRDIQTDLSDDTKKANLDKLIAAVDTMAALDDIEPTTQTDGSAWSSNPILAVTNEYAAADHYALIATGEGSGWVTIVENDGPEAKSLSVTLHTLYVGTNLYSGKIVTLTDPNNVLSEQVSAMYTAPLGKAANDFKFEWYYGDEPADGHVPTVPTVPTAAPTDTAKGGDSAWSGSAASQSAVGATTIDTVRNANSGSVSMKDLVNRYWTMHYRANEGSKAYLMTGDRWSSWCSPALAEGWLQRVLNAITPFSQRLTDLYNNPAEMTYTMPAQIGKPWVGDVALNNDNLTEVGLEEFYRTILNRAESMSIAQGAGTTPDDTSAAVNKQLLEATARLVDMQMTLGGEAYADAQNPLIASEDGTEYSGAVFCFANQLPSLLDEELALLRGRTKNVAPDLSTYPFYNRLIWNFTKGETQGEVAYVNNYNIQAVDGVLDAEAAAKMYPQGHGDAYGYYLSAVKSYYRLLRNPNFTWGDPAMLSMSIADHVVNMDYQEEDKFAEAAYDMAKIGAEVVSLTARKQYRDAADTRSAYFDNTNTVLSTSTSELNLPQAFGYGEWGVRSGYGAFVNWAVANTLLPEDEDSAVTYFSDDSIATITRATSTSLALLGGMVEKIERTVEDMDSGLNPLGLSRNAIPFDLSADDYEDGDCHYDQIRKRAGTALANAKAVLDYANVYNARLREIENDSSDDYDDEEEMEAAYEAQLIEIYGRPYADDIGPGQTYAQGYTGPDLYHYMYTDLSEYGLESVDDYSARIKVEVATDSTISTDWRSLVAGGADITNGLSFVLNVDQSVWFELTGEGFVAMPTNWVGERASEGQMQTACRDLLSAYVAAKAAYEAYESAASSYDSTLASTEATFIQQDKNYQAKIESYKQQRAYAISQGVLNSFSIGLNIVSLFTSGEMISKIKKMRSDVQDGSDATCIYYEYVEDPAKNEATYVTELKAQYATEAKCATIRKSLTKLLKESFYNNTLDSDKITESINKDIIADDVANVEQKTKDTLTEMSKSLSDDYMKKTLGKDANYTLTDADRQTAKDQFVSENKNSITAAGAKSADKVQNATAVKVTERKVSTNIIRQDGTMLKITGMSSDVLDLVKRLDEMATTDPKNAEKYINDLKNAYNNSDPTLVPNQDANIVQTDMELVGKASTIGTKNAVRRALFTVKNMNKWTTCANLAVILPTIQGLATAVKMSNLELSEATQNYQLYSDERNALTSIVNAGTKLTTAAQDFLEAHATLLEASQTYLAVYETGKTIQEMRAAARAKFANLATRTRYRDMYARVARNAALSKYSDAFDAAQRQVYELAKAYDYETGMGPTALTAGGGTFADESIRTRALGTEDVIGDGSSVLDPGLWDVVNRMDANFAIQKTRLGINNSDKSEKWFSLRTGLLNLSPKTEGDEAWQSQLASWWREDVFADADVERLCQRPTGSTGAEPGFVIPFESAIYMDRNFFNRVLGKFDDAGYSSSDCSTKIVAAGIDFINYDNLVEANALVAEPNVYLVPAGTDYLRAPSNGVRVVRSFNVVDQVLPIPYAVSDDEVEADGWTISTGIDSALSTYGTRRFSTMCACAGFSSKRLIGRSVWNGRWVLVIPARYLHSNIETARRNFLYGAKGLGGVKDIKIGFRAYSRSGN